MWLSAFFQFACKPKKTLKNLQNGSSLLNVYIQNDACNFCIQCGMTENTLSISLIKETQLFMTKK